jgi:hypothetical protein
MLKISQTTRSGCVIIKLEGRLLGPWVDVVRIECDQVAQPFTRLYLDLSAVTFVDAPGTEFLRELIRRGAGIKDFSSFTKELLQPEAF